MRRPTLYAALIDVTMITTALLAARLLRYSDQFPAFVNAPPIGRSAVAVLVLVWIAAMAVTRVYERSLMLAGFELYRRIFLADSLALIAVVGFTYFSVSQYISRGYLVVGWLFVLLLVSAGRFVMRQHLYGQAARGRRLNRVIVVGANRHGIAIAHQLVLARSASATVIGFLDDFRPLGSEILPGLRVLGDPMRLNQVAAETRATHAVVVESGISWESHQWLVTNPELTGSLIVLTAPGLYDLTTTRMELRQLGPVPLLQPNRAAISGLDATLKRGFDVVAALVLLVVTAPLQAFIAWRLWPNAFQVRRVVAYGGHELRLLEFRARPRMRQFHMARLPSLVNVLTGSLSLVGPRPLEAGENSAYADWMPLLQAAKPGFIGPWWLVGLGRPENLEEEIMLDLHYLRNYSVWFDLHVLAQTARSLLRPAAWEMPAAGPAAGGSSVRGAP